MQKFSENTPAKNKKGESLHDEKKRAKFVKRVNKLQVQSLGELLHVAVGLRYASLVYRTVFHCCLMISRVSQLFVVQKRMTKIKKKLSSEFAFSSQVEQLCIGTVPEPSIRHTTLFHHLRTGCQPSQVHSLFLSIESQNVGV